MSNGDKASCDRVSPGHTSIPMNLANERTNERELYIENALSRFSRYGYIFTGPVSGWMLDEHGLTSSAFSRPI